MELVWVGWWEKKKLRSSAMAARQTFRARPIDIVQTLQIVRDTSLLNADESTVTRDVSHAHKALDKENEAVRCAWPQPCPKSGVPEITPIKIFLP